MEEQRNTLVHRAEIERVLIRFTEDILGVRNVMRTDDFFAYGGASLAIAQLTMHIEERFGIEISIVEVLDARSLAELAAKVDELAAP